VDVKRGIIWDSIASIGPDAFLWTGDTIYPPSKGVASTDKLEEEYNNMLTNATVGYSKFISPPRTDIGSLARLNGGIHGTWDDHDYGGNDYGNEMPNREERRVLFFNFLKASNEHLHNQISYPYHRNGVYNSVSFGTAPHKILVLFLDTRWGRESNCIPSLGRTKIPLGSVLASVTRWITAGLHLEKVWKSRCQDQTMMLEEQWIWLRRKLEQSDAQVHIIVSSIQIMTTNPAVESWGHFPTERKRLLKLLTEVEVEGLILLSGDVHHGEILDTASSFTTSTKQSKASSGYNQDNGSPVDNQETVKTASSYDAKVNGRLFEVTSSGLTHSCDEPFYGPLCAPILNTFSKHRYHEYTPSYSYENNNNVSQNYYTGRNFGSINIDWAEQEGPDTEEPTKMKVNIHNEFGDTILTTGSLPLSTYASRMSDQQLDNIPKCNDGHLLPLAGCFLALICVIFIISQVRKNFKMKTKLGCTEAFILKKKR